MRALASAWPWPRWLVVTAVTIPALVAVAGIIANRSVGPTAAAALLAAGFVILFALLVLVARWLQRADDGLRVGERALEAVPHAIFVVDSLQPGRSNRYVNPAYAALTGYGVAEALGDGFDALTIFADPAQAAALEGELATSTTNRITLRRRGGTLAAAKLELRAVPRRHGGRYIVGLLEEIKGGERSVDRQPRPRPDTGAAGTVTAGRAKDAFLSTLSHDLRSPLNACVMWLDVLALAPQPDKLTQAVEAIRRNLGRQTRLVNDLNDAAKISSGGLEVQLEPLDLVILLKRHLDAWQLLAIGKQLTFQHGIEPASAYVDADPERLSQALNHLVENAVASTPAGGRVELRMRTSQDAHIVEIEDTGTALSAEDAANLGAPLWRAPADAKGRTGLGLSLAVAHHLAAQHRGTLTAASRRAGALFTLTLPTAAGGDREQGTLTAADRPSSEL